jgi:hypothetical protein
MRWDEHGAVYERVGRFTLAAMSVLGWGTGLLLPLPHHVLALLMAFVAGAIIINSAIMETAIGKRRQVRPIHER